MIPNPSYWSTINQVLNHKNNIHHPPEKVSNQSSDHNENSGCGGTCTSLCVSSCTSCTGSCHGTCFGCSGGCEGSSFGAHSCTGTVVGKKIKRKKFLRKKKEDHNHITVGEFIKKFMAPNTVIRLWKDYKDDIASGHIMLMETDTMMSWEVEAIPDFANLPFVCITTDVITERNIEVVNIITDTELTQDECENIYQTYRMKR